ncbi:MAG: hypothetical protein PUD89_01385 [Bacteroidales bacterium]|nr:hypothetical protein [Bacteroidales bacterium]
MKKILFVVISAVLTLAIQAQEKVSNYFYPKYSQEYTWQPESDFPQELEIIVSYRGWEQVIQEKLRMTDQNGYPMGSTITIYAYDISDDAVISTGQLYSNFLGESRRNDRITILKLPSKQNTWIEYNKGEKYECKSEWVYVSYKNNEGKSVIQKAVKMTKSTVVKLKTITEFSYWTKYGEIASFGKWDSDTPTILRIANFISTNEIKEVSKQEYEAYAEAERKAELERKYQQFVSNLKPQKLSKENPEAANLIHKLFLDLEESRYSQMVFDGKTIVSDYTQLHITIPPESDFLVKAPNSEQDTIASYVAELLGNGTLKIASVIEPNTSRECLLEQYFSESYHVHIKTQTFNVVKKKDSWILADKKATMPEEYAPYIKKAAQGVYDTNRKVKKQTVELRLLYVESQIMKVWHVQNDMHTTKTNYINLKNDWLD